MWFPFPNDVDQVGNSAADILLHKQPYNCTSYQQYLVKFTMAAAPTDSSTCSEAVALTSLIAILQLFVPHTALNHDLVKSHLLLIKRVGRSYLTYKLVLSMGRVCVRHGEAKPPPKKKFSKA